MSNLHLFYADFIKKHGKLTSKQQELLQQAFFPGFADLNPNERMMDSLRDFQQAYGKWETEQASIKKPLPPMDDAEIEALAAIW